MVKSDFTLNLKFSWADIGFQEGGGVESTQK